MASQCHARLAEEWSVKSYIDELSLTGLTSDPTNFILAIKDDGTFDEAIVKKLKRGRVAEELFFELALEYLTRAADLFRPIYDRTNGVDGWVSLKLSPLLAQNTAGILPRPRICTPGVNVPTS